MSARKVLLIDDDRLQFRLTQAHFEQFRTEKFVLEWSGSYEEGLARLLEGGYAACLLDYQLGERDGLTLIREAVEAGCRVPIIFLTAETGGDVDIQAMDLGALDYLIKGEINTRSLERSLRYALKLGETLDALHRLATHDELTGLLNRREFERLLQDEDARFRRFGHPYALIMFDLDYFKSVNDTHGHPAGDAVLQEVAGRIAAQIRSVDRFARIGGEEFAIMVTEADQIAAADIARRIVACMAATPVVLADGTPLEITLSAGSAAVPGNVNDVASLITAADQSLYAAKARGRNCAVAAN